MALGSLRPSPLVEQAAERLREQIADGQWPVGAKLPGETTLATSLGVGRSTVREALRALAGAGLVRSRQGAGVFVIASRPVEDWPGRLRRAALVDVYEVRAMLEVQAARIAAVRRTPEDAVALRAALAARTAAARAAADGRGADGRVLQVPVVRHLDGPVPGEATGWSVAGAGAADPGGAGVAGHGGDPAGADEPGPGEAGPGLAMAQPEADEAGTGGAEADGHDAAAERGAAFIDADIALHAAVVAAAHNPVLTDLFAEFAPVLRKNLLGLLDLMDVRAHDEAHGEAAHTALVEAIVAGDPDTAARVLSAELDSTQAHLRAEEAGQEAGR
jgi:GntR family transcriptional regulator, transcriptional repressor for pyruvate dehydrogenase complex